MEGRLGTDFSGVRVRASAPNARAIGSPGDAVEQAADRVATRTEPTPDAPRRPSGSVDLSAVRVHTDDAAAASAQAIGARAYALGSHLAFAPGAYSPSTAQGQRVLTHELAHVAEQQRSGGGEVVRRFTAYTSDDQTSGTSQGWLHPDGNKLRVADDGLIAAEDNGWGAGRSQRAWAIPDKLPESNKILAEQKSIAQLRMKPAGKSIAGKAPASGATSTLQEVEPIKRVGHDDSTTTGAVVGGVVGGLALGAAGAGIGFKAGENGNSQLEATLVGGAVGAIVGAVAGALSGAAIEKSANAFELTSDCGTAAREVMGSHSQGKKDVCMIPGAAGGEEALTARSYHGGNPTTPEEWSEEVFKKEFGSGLSRSEAYAKYNALSTESKDGKPSEKEAFDRKYGINKYAVPRVGQGITTSTEKDMPGFDGGGRRYWNFHFAAPVLQSGQDYITLESAAGWGGTDWIFFMYGPESKAQSFHEFHVGTGTHGNKATSMVVQPEP